MKLHSLLGALGAPTQDAEEETFELFAQELPSQNLGFIDSKATTLDLTVAGRDLAIHQSPGVLSSNRAGGTTGAVVWKITPLFAEWLSSPSNPLFVHGVLSHSSLVVELGCGIAGLVALLLAPRIAGYLLTDQPYVAKLVDQNVRENWRTAVSAPTSSSRASKSSSAVLGTSPTPSKTRRGSLAAGASGGGARRGRLKETAGGDDNRIRFTPLDWETDRVTPVLLTKFGWSSPGGEANRSFDVVLACDCIYNEALVDPFVSTCVDLCRLRVAEREKEQEDGEPCVCVVAQQLRDPLVFEAWIKRFSRSFHTWRVPDPLLAEGLKSNSGFVVHIGVLKDDISLDAI
ncbi:ribosomal lysine N-methyltransferase 5 [Corynascus novoguineensis]|uniref:Ribosomal lysine N-methyltransferase 5 n=1 Tax=Corynascus novoguineensis TaxID=1126955 RepID=A0AAN7CTY5_9PEZI|nr:ribosomal lysine N-methyltransferase 5 [Corynascus novoguineensis]